MNGSPSNIEDQLAELTGRRHCVLTGRATSAIYLLLRALFPLGGRIVVPGIVCPNPVNAVFYSGCEPVFCDVNLTDFTIDCEHLEKLFQSGVDGVIVVNLYGHMADWSTILRMAEKYGVVVIEDAAQSLGASLAGSPSGSFGIASIMSFGHTKLIHEVSAGAVVTDDEGLADAIRELSSGLPKKHLHVDELSTLYNKTYYAIRDVVLQDERVKPLFGSLKDVFRDIFLYQHQPDHLLRLGSLINDIQRRVERRSRVSQVYANALRDDAIVRPSVRGVPAWWRYSFLVDLPDRNQFTHRLRQKGLDVSQWYPDVSGWYQKHGPELPNARQIENRVINLWTDITVEEAKENIRSVKAELSKEKARS